MLESWGKEACRRRYDPACRRERLAQVIGRLVKGIEEMSADDVEARVSQIVEAQIIATHAYQVALAARSEKADKECWTAAGLTPAGLCALVKHQQSLLSEKPQTVKDWAKGRKSGFDPSKGLTPILDSPLRAAAAGLPVKVFTDYLLSKTGCSPVQARAVASLLQMQLDIDRDGDRLQELYALYVALGLPVHTERLGMPERTDEEFLATAHEIVPKLCACPFETDAKALRMLFRKMWNWGHRHTRERDKSTLAKELLNEPDVKKLIPKIKRMPAQRIAVIGHSYTMDVNWSSPSSFVPVVIEMLRKHNARVQVRQWQAGGLSPARADFAAFSREALEWKPDQVLFVLAFMDKKDPPALEKAAGDFVQAGVKAAIFDTLYGNARPTVKYYPERNTIEEICCRTGMTVIEAGPALNASSDLERFVSLDGVHMTEPYHRVMAKEWLRYLCDAK
jgi:hypothetical protein